MTKTLQIIAIIASFIILIAYLLNSRGNIRNTYCSLYYNEEELGAMANELIFQQNIEKQ